MERTGGHAGHHHQRWRARHHHAVSDPRWRDDCHPDLHARVEPARAAAVRRRADVHLPGWRSDPRAAAGHEARRARGHRADGHGPRHDRSDRGRMSCAFPPVPTLAFPVLPSLALPSVPSLPVVPALPGIPLPGLPAPSTLAFPVLPSLALPSVPEPPTLPTLPALPLPGLPAPAVPSFPLPIPAQPSLPAIPELPTQFCPLT